VHQLSGYSAHAGQADLLNFVEGINPAPKEIRVVHGDGPAKAQLRTLLEERVAARVVVPG
jgi:metallo-beta-lactamase family protein